MRRLMLARHAKSSWDDFGLADHDRPLNARGREAATLVGEAMSEGGYIPDVVYSSTSVRTRETWGLLEPHFGGRPEAEFLPELYLASPRAVLGIIQSAPPDARSLMVLGHNPSTHAVAAGLSRSGHHPLIDRVRYKFPTGAVAVIDLAGDGWADAEEGGELVELILPRRLG